LGREAGTFRIKIDSYYKNSCETSLLPSPPEKEEPVIPNGVRDLIVLDYHNTWYAKLYRVQDDTHIKKLSGQSTDRTIL
jgi:hypothetical protein